MIGCSNDVTERRQLQEELLKVATSEQQRIGQELHDVTGQELTGLRYLSRSLVRMLDQRSRINVAPGTGNGVMASSMVVLAGGSWSNLDLQTSKLEMNSS